MNSSAKFSFMLLGATALGGVAFACSVSSGTVDDTDGGVNQNTSSSSSSGTTTSSSSSSGTVEVCPEFDAGFQIDSEGCNTCLLTKCCSQTAAAYDIPVEALDGGPVDDYVAELTHCDDDPGAQGVDACKNLTFQSATDNGLSAAYDQYLGCRLGSCQVECAAQTLPDAGAN